MTRYRLTLEYDGAGFVGWQRQANGASIQEELEKAVHGFCGETVTVHGAGRTDAGVHALGQVAHVDIQRETDALTVRDALNAHLRPHPITVCLAEAVSDEFHARFSAVERSYLYRILNRRAPAALLRGKVWHVPSDLDVAAMVEAARVLVGHHDFTTFRATLCQAKSPVKTLDRLSVTRDGEELLVCAQARSFLHHRVRNMVGTLKLVGDGKWTAEDVAAALEARDRSKGGPTAPADGLYLMNVRYPSTKR